MPGQYGWVVGDGLMLGVSDDLNGDVLGAERHHVQSGTDTLVVRQDLGDSLAIETPLGNLEDLHAIGLSCRGCGEKIRGLEGGQLDQTNTVLPTKVFAFGSTFLMIRCVSVVVVGGGAEHKWCGVTVI